MLRCILQVRLSNIMFCMPHDACRIPKEKYFPVPGVDGALVTFKLLAPAQRLEVSDERGFISMVRHLSGISKQSRISAALQGCAACMVCCLHAAASCLRERHDDNLPARGFRTLTVLQDKPCWA